MNKTMSALAILAALLLTACGGKGSTSETSQTAAASSAVAPTTVSADSCEAKGITAADPTPGRCTDGDAVLVVAGRDEPVRLERATVRLMHLATKKTVDGGDYAPTSNAVGRYVIVHLRVKNRGNKPESWPSGLGATALQIDGNTYAATTDPVAFAYAYKTAGDPGQEASGGGIQPGRTADAWAAFDVPTKQAAKLKQRGSKLLVVDAEDAQNGYDAVSETASTRGAILLWK